ncbi:MAG: endolytic transglycosylase MltG [Chloroflexota bacterium]
MARRRTRYDDEPQQRVPGFLRFMLFAGLLSVVVLVALLTALRPLVRAAVVGWAWDNPNSMLRVAFVGDLVREDLGEVLVEPASSDSTESAFDVNPGDTIFDVAPRLEEGGYVRNQRAFLYAALEQGLPAKLTSGTFVLRLDMTPSEVAEALVRARVQLTTVNVTFREGLRLEQMAALLETVQSGVDPAAFYELAKHPTPELLAGYSWLKLPEGASLEGYLYPATYTLVISSSGGPVQATDAEDLVKMLLDTFRTTVGADRMQVPEDRGMTFDQVVTLASLVEREAVVDEERALIAGVYQNRLDGLDGVPKILNADPSIIYALDSVALESQDFATWPEYFFWAVPQQKLSDVALPEALQGYQSYQVAGLPPGPICTPSLASIDAALHPNTSEGYLYFVAVPNEHTHAFARTLGEHNANLHKYGYQ